MGIDVQEVTADRGELIEAAAQVWGEAAQVLSPGDPPMTAAQLAVELFVIPAHLYFRSWVAFRDGVPAGLLTVELETDPANRHLAQSRWFWVAGPHRRHGVADALLRTALADLETDGRSSLLLWVPTLDPDVGSTYAERLGLELRSEDRCSRVRVPDLPEETVARWIDEGHARTDGYRLVDLGAACPDEHLDAYVDAIRAMDDVPVDGLEWAVAPTDQALVRSRELVWGQRDYIVARTLAVAPDGSGAGFTELFVSRHSPTVGHQGDTGVVVAHRGHGLGRWLKATNLRTALRLAPELTVVETYNAQSNPWMLDINVAMGFRPHMVWRGFQGELAHARAVVTGGG